MYLEREYVHWLLTVPGVGYLRSRKLLERFANAAAVWDASLAELLQVPSITPKVAAAIADSRKSYSFREQADFLNRNGIRVLHKSDLEFPQVLLQIYDPPHILYTKGNFSPDDEKAIGVVGTRNASNYGVLVANKLCSELAGAGITIVSGLARGIDTVAHEAALQAEGRTIAVLAGGVENVYPSENRRLAQRIIRNGLLVSEFPPPVSAHPGMFPVRNRIISGLSRGVIVVEAAIKSGSLITANQALEQGREVFAVPGPITSPLSQGTHDLIRQGARLVTSAQDVWEEFPGWVTNNSHVIKDGLIELNSVERQLLDTIGYGGVHMDHLLRATNLPQGDVYRLLLEMELKGLIRQLPGQMYMRSGV